MHMNEGVHNSHETSSLKNRNDFFSSQTERVTLKKLKNKKKETKKKKRKTHYQI